jgi:hypothetical protein
MLNHNNNTNIIIIFMTGSIKGGGKVEFDVFSVDGRVG